METPTPYQAALALSQSGAAHNSILTDSVLSQIVTIDEAFAVLRALEAKFCFNAMVVSLEDLRNYMQERENEEQWFTSRGFDGVPEITEQQIADLNRGAYAWDEVINEEVLFPKAEKNFRYVIEAMFSSAPN